MVDRLAVVGLIEKPVQLRRRCAESTHEFAFRERTGVGSLLRFDGEPVEQEVPQIAGILVVLEHLLHVHRAAAAGVEHIGERLPAGLLIHEALAHGILDRRRRVPLRKRQHQCLRGCADLKRLLAVVVLDGADLHSSPSASSSAMVRSGEKGNRSVRGHG